MYFYVPSVYSAPNRPLVQASQSGTNVVKMVRDNDVVHNLIFKWLRMWQHERRVADPAVQRQLRQHR